MRARALPIIFDALVERSSAIKRVDVALYEGEDGGRDRHVIANL
jgi:PleD family two-component response regulator